MTSRILLSTLLLLLVACAGVPFDYPRVVSTALPPDARTHLGAIDLQWQEEHGGLSGILGLTNGVDALGVDQPFTLLNAHPNIEVRLFNPLSRQSFKYWSYLLDFKRANRRMHNKSFTVDNAVTIVGGRNIGEEYFELNQDVKFDDLEVLAIGPVVGQVSAGFDDFWNSELSVPMEAFKVKVAPARLEQWRKMMRAEIDQGATGTYGRAVGSTLMQEIREGVVQPVPAWSAMISDSPEKLLNAVGDMDQATLAREKSRRFRAARREVIIITPYFIPLDSGSRLLEDLLTRGVKGGNTERCCGKL